MCEVCVRRVTGRGEVWYSEYIPESTTARFTGTGIGPELASIRVLFCDKFVRLIVAIVSAV